jgi:hypothetical protein
LPLSRKAPGRVLTSVGAGLAAAGQQLVPCVVVGAVVCLAVALVVVAPAIWSSKSCRRRAAFTVLVAVLHLLKRGQRPEIGPAYPVSTTRGQPQGSR